MNMHLANLARTSLDRRLAPLRPVDLTPPPRGWLRAVREALGMTARQLAARLGVVPSRIVALEAAEATGGTTLRSMRDAAAAMDCTFVYAVIPNRDLDSVLRARAAAMADGEVERVAQSLRLEHRPMDAGARLAMRERLIAGHMAGPPRRLWDAP